MEPYSKRAKILHFFVSSVRNKVFISNPLFIRHIPLQWKKESRKYIYIIQTQSINLSDISFPFSLNLFTQSARNTIKAKLNPIIFNACFKQTTLTRLHVSKPIFVLGWKFTTDYLCNNRRETPASTSKQCHRKKIYVCIFVYIITDKGQGKSWSALQMTLTNYPSGWPPPDLLLLKTHSLLFFFR